MVDASGKAETRVKRRNDSKRAFMRSEFLKMSKVGTWKAQIGWLAVCGGWLLKKKESRSDKLEFQKWDKVNWKLRILAGLKWEWCESWTVGRVKTCLTRTNQRVSEWVADFLRRPKRCAVNGGERDKRETAIQSRNWWELLYVYLCVLLQSLVRAHEDVHIILMPIHKKELPQNGNETGKNATYSRFT